MRITVFGATGGTGRQVVRQALDAGHQVTAVVRNAAGLIEQHPALDVVTADVMDPDAITPAVKGADAVVSALGPRSREETTVCSSGARAIVAAMHAAGTRRLVVVTASGHVVDEGDGPVTRAVVKPLLRRYLRGSFADFARTDRIVQDSGLDWTIMRPPRLTDGRSRPYRTAIDRNVRGGFTIARADLARAILVALADRAAIGHSIALGY
ncbi:Putative NADH-flavin reductase [Pseudonocardia thermophila]|jgi:Putative NADH-flavin reductase|uniref:Putative NADH-flavin reductase n=1 Tax=Pseudonocardia thermophila TaxID=1848 RepID=A0A1M6ZKQ7_PSETH|nr:SDR family oxidoreductase [Pseudonocardia thermophila]SHL31066.1 Putative NADH-flavin reductase [Pseudonocardia thermophila]